MYGTEPIFISKLIFQKLKKKYYSVHLSNSIGQTIKLKNYFGTLKRKQNFIHTKMREKQPVHDIPSLARKGKEKCSVHITGTGSHLFAISSTFA